MNKGLILLSLIVFAAATCGCKNGSSFDAEFEKATKVIAQRDTWPESPENVSAAFWNARYNRNYSEMHIFWPGSASFNWSEICAKDGGAKFVFGTARIYTSYWNTEPVEEAEVPYASEEYFRKHGSYNLTMRLRALNTQRGERWYVWSGN